MVLAFCSRRLNFSLLFPLLSKLLNMVMALMAYLSSKWVLELLVFFATCGVLLSILILFLFFVVSKKSETESLSSSVFECGFSSYYFSRFSFSMHYFTIGLIFLFLDLELVYLMPFFNMDFCDAKSSFLIWMFICVLVLGLLEEWKFNMLDWKF